MDSLKHIFSFKGRINRLKYITHLFLFGIGLFLVSFPFSYLPEYIGIILSIGLIIIYLWGVFGLTIRRVHDFNKSEWWSLLILVPIINIFLFLRPGTSETNKYGNVPEENTLAVKIIGSTAIFLAIGPFFIALLSQVPTSDDTWAYGSYCNDPNHKDIHKIFEGRDAGLRNCLDFMEEHPELHRCQKTECGEIHSTGCKLVEAPFPWYFSIEK